MKRLPLLLLLQTTGFAQGVITTYAGGGGQFTGDGRPAISAQIVRPGDVAVDSKGNVLFTAPSQHMIMQVTTDGTLLVVVGNGLNAHSGDGGPARAASVRTPTGLKLDGSGNILISDDSIRSIGADGIVRAVAGVGFGFSGDGGPAIKAAIDTQGVIADAAGNVYIADGFNGRIRMVTPSGVISTVAGNGQPGSSGSGGPATAASLTYPTGLAIDSAGRIYFSERFGHRVRRFTVGGAITDVAGTGQAGFSGDGGPATQAALNQPAGLAFDSTGALYIADRLNNRIRRVAPGGTITTVAGNGTSTFQGDGKQAIAASLGAPTGVATGADGSIYVADTENDRIRKIAPDGTITTIAGSGSFLGDGAMSTSARLDSPFSVTLDPAGNLFVLTADLRIRKVAPNGTISTIAGTGRATGAAGNGGPAVNATLRNPIAIAADSSGNVFLADSGLRKIAPDGTISSFASASGGAIAIDSAGNLYTSPGSTVVKVTPSGQTTPVAGNGQTGYSGDGGPALSASFGFQIRGLAVGRDGSIYISDYANNRVRRVDAAGTISTFAGNGSNTTAGDGGPATAAGVATPRGLQFDAKGNLYITEDFNIVRKVAPDGTIGTYAGSVRFGFSGDGGGALSAAIAYPQAIAVDPSGNLYIADSANDRIRVVLAGAGPFLLLSQKGLTFKTGASAATQSLTVVNSGQGTVNWAVSTSVATAGPNWLSATPVIGSSPAGQAGPAIAVKADPAGLAPGDYYGQVVVSAPGVPNSPQSVTVVLSVPAAGSGGGSSVQPSGLIFTGTPGAVDPPAQNLSLATNTAGGTKFGANVVFGDGRAWFTFQPSSGTVQPGAPVTMQVKPVLSGFAAGVYNAVITVAFDDLTTQQVNLLLVVSPGTGTAKPQSISTAGCAPGRLLPLFTSLGSGFAATTGWPASVEVRIVDDCGGPLVKGSVTASFSNNDPELTLNSLLDGRWTGTWQAGNSGNVSVTVQARDSAGALSGSAQVNGALNANANPPPVVASGGVLDAASYNLGAPVAPGSLVAIFGQYLAQQQNSATALPLPNTLGATQVTVAGRTMPLLFAGVNQVNAMIPYDLAINATHQVVVKRGNTISIPEPVSLISSRSGVFTKDLTGKGSAIVVKAAADGTQSIVAPGNPVSAYDAIVIYGDGLGNVEPQAIAGSETPVNPLSHTLDAVKVTIGGVDAPVFFAGLTPGFTGLYQVNAYVPTGVTPGDNVPLVITQAGRTSPPVSISVR